MFGTNNVAGETFAAARVVDLKLFELVDTGQVQEIAIDRESILAVRIRMRHTCPMQLGPQQSNLHIITSVIIVTDVVLLLFAS
jgi:hypothetical protein